jgi:hypothetical protein
MPHYHSLLSDGSGSLLTVVKSFKVKAMLWLMVSQTISLDARHPSGAQDQLFITVSQLQVRSCRVTSLTTGWSRDLQLLLALSGPSPMGLLTTFHCLRFETWQCEGPGPCIYIPQAQDGPVIHPGTWFPFHHLLQFAGLWSRWLLTRSQIRSYITPDGQSVSQYVLVTSPLWDLRSDIISVWKLLSLWGAISEERSGLSLVSQSAVFVHCQVLFRSFFHFTCHTCFMYIQYMQGLSQPRLSTADHAPSFVAYTITAV